MQEISVEELKDALGQKNVMLIDVREPFEWIEWRIPQAVNRPFSSLDLHMDALRDATTVYLHCQSGGRSSRATEYLAKEGIHAVNVRGGIRAWEAAGFPIDRG